MTSHSSSSSDQNIDDSIENQLSSMTIPEGSSSQCSSSNDATSASGPYDNDNDDVYIHRNDSLVVEDKDEDGGKSRWVRAKRHLNEVIAASVFVRFCINVLKLVIRLKLKLNGGVFKRNGGYLKLNGGGRNLNGGSSHFLLLISHIRYGDEHKLAGFSATLQAIISFVEDGGDRVKLVRAGKHQVVFLVKGPIYLVCISCTEEPYESLQGQLELLYGQMLLILTKSVNRCFEKNPKFDMTPLLGGTDAVFSSLFHSFSWNPATFLHAYTCVPLPYATRQVAGSILQDVADSGVLFAMLMCGNKVVSLVGAQKVSLHPDDMLLLANFVMSSESFRTSESFSPICLPRYNPMAFLHAYVHFIDVDTYLVLLTSSSDAFFHLKECRILTEKVLLKSNVLSEVQRSLLKGGMRVEDLPVYPSTRSGSLFNLNDPRLTTEPQERLHGSGLGIGGPGGLWHFIYRSMYFDQYVSSEFSPPISSNHLQQKRLYRAYQKVYASMHDTVNGPHKTQFKRDKNYVLLCWITQDFELIAAFDPLADKALAIKICNRVCQWVKDVENEIFLPGGSSFSWVSLLPLDSSLLLWVLRPFEAVVGVYKTGFWWPLAAVHSGCYSGFAVASLLVVTVVSLVLVSAADSSLSPTCSDIASFSVLL
ncbi:vacuolar fusion protein MON1 [Artemisia annua]|uniref:Vacuolar fusion protein MON1 homolog n=1 Tax=Artemisia annua TaxID=35608 RepID=A0A2U1KWY2_ARTAN|nr:vacuolar fusion protein MON1 [Artemisia annua]